MAIIIINICITSYYFLTFVMSFSYYFLNIFTFCSYVHGVFFLGHCDRH